MILPQGLVAGGRAGDDFATDGRGREGGSDGEMGEGRERGQGGDGGVLSEEENQEKVVNESETSEEATGRGDTQGTHKIRPKETETSSVEVEGDQRRSEGTEMSDDGSRNDGIYEEDRNISGNEMRLQFGN